MVNLREFWSPEKFVTKLGALKFPTNIFYEEQRTPHYEMDKAMELFETRPMVNAGIKQIARFIAGEEITVRSSDKRTHEFLNDWIKLRPDLDNEIFNFIINILVTGNGYVEMAWKKMANGDLVLDNIYNINDVSRVYKNLDYRGNDDQFWLYEVPIEVRMFPFMGEVKTPSFWKINYVYGSYLFQKMIWAIPIHKSKIRHCKIGWSRDNLYGRCLPYDARVETDEGLLRIGSIVTSKRKVNVKSWNFEKQEFEYKPIINYYSRKGDGKLYSISYGNSYKNTTLTATPEHPILTDKGFVKAQDLVIGNKIAIKTNILNEKQKELIYGTLLGDSVIYKPKYKKEYKGLCEFRTKHSENQRVYLDWLSSSLKNMGIRENRLVSQSPHYKNRKFNHILLSTKRNIQFNEIRDVCYKDNKKKITKEWIDKLTPLSIACWMMDDGSICSCTGYNKEKGKYRKFCGFVFCTDSFDLDECELLKNHLKEKFGLDSNIQCPKSTNKNRIWLNKTNTLKLQEIVKDYIKLDLDNFKKVWIANPIENEEKEKIYFTPITDIKIKESKKRVYDIEVEGNHNFVVQNVVIHNSFLASAIDDGEVLKEILKNFSVIARYRALGRKIISIGSPEDPATLEDMDKLESDLKQIEDKDHIVVNKPIRAEPLSYTGENDPMETQIEFLRRDIASGLVPNYLTPWSSEVNRATSQEAKIPFELEIKSIQSDIIQFLNKTIIDELRKVYPWIAKDATFDFGHVDLETNEEKANYAITLYQNNLITLNEMRKMIGFDSIGGGDRFLRDIESSPTVPGSPPMVEMAEFYKGMKLPQGWSKLDERKVFNKSYNVVFEVVEGIDKDQHGHLVPIYEVKQNGEVTKKFYNLDEAMQEVWKNMLSISRGLETLTEYKEQVTTEDEKFLKKVGLKKNSNSEYKIVRSRDVNGRKLRLVSYGSGYLVFDGIDLLKEFLKDEREAANVYFDTIVEKREKALDDFYNEELPEHEEMDRFFDEIKRLHAEVIDEIFKELPKSKVKVERWLKEQTTVGGDIYPKLDDVFDRFNKKISDTINNAVSNLVGFVIKPKVKLGKDPDASPEAERKVREKAEVLRKRMEQQVKSFNDRAKTDIVRTISDGIAADKSPNDIKNEIKLKYDKYKVKEAPQDYQIERVAKTEVINNVNLLKLIKWKEMGFEKAEQLVHIDERTCEVCKPLNHRIFDIDYLLENPDKRAALHPNCRCTYVAYS